MNTFDIIQIILAAWGAGLATILGLRELGKETRRLRVFLDHIHWVERHQLIVVNIGHRPITITDVGVRVIPKRLGERDDPEFQRSIGPDTRPEFSSPTLPLTLTDGESASFLISEQVGRFIHSNDYAFRAYARDAEGKEYVTKKMRAFDAKYNRYFSE